MHHDESCLTKIEIVSVLDYGYLIANIKVQWHAFGWKLYFSEMK